MIDTEGRIAIAHYGHDIDDHVPLDTVSEWLRTQIVAVEHPELNPQP